MSIEGKKNNIRGWLELIGAIISALLGFIAKDMMV